MPVEVVGIKGVPVTAADLKDTQGGGGGIPEAPSDGSLYGRKDESWQKVSEQVNADWSATSGKAQILNKPTIPEAQVNADWNATSGKAEVLNKPTIPAPQVQTDWSATSGISSIAKKPSFSMYVDNSQGSNVFVGQTALMTSSTGTTGMFATIDSNGAVTFTLRGASAGSDNISFANSVSAKSITVSDAVGYIRPQIQSDWTQTDTTKADYIKNKPENAQTQLAAMSPVSGLASMTDLVTSFNNLIAEMKENGLMASK